MRMRARGASRLALAAVAVGGLLTTVTPVTASAASADPHVASGGMAGVVPARGARTGPAGSTPLLTWHSGPVMHGTTVQVIFWGTSWPGYRGDKMTGLAGFYSGLGGTKYMGTNTEYSDASGTVSSSVSYQGQVTDSSAAPRHAPSTSAVLAEVAKLFPNPTPNGYYPVYVDQMRGHAGYCAWHSSGTINGVRVQFGFFFNLDGDPGCDPQSTYGQSQGLAALGNVSGHEISEMVTDPQLNAWYDSAGSENADKCAWTFSGNAVSIGGQSWKIQGNFSNKAYGTHSGYDGAGCIDQ